VLALVFDYLAVLRGDGGISEPVWEENRALAELRFNFTERLQPFAAATALAHAMQDYGDRCRHILANLPILNLRCYTERLQPPSAAAAVALEHAMQDYDSRCECRTLRLQN